MIGPMSKKIVDIVNNYMSSGKTTEDKASACSSLETVLDEVFEECGLGGLKGLTGSGMMCAMYMLYGLEIIPLETVDSFRNNPPPKDAIQYSISFIPSENEDKIFSFSVGYLTRPDFNKLTNK